MTAYYERRQTVLRMNRETNTYNIGRLLENVRFQHLIRNC